MNDDPSLKEILNAASGIPKKVGKSLLETKIPVSKVKDVIGFVLLHWLAAVLSLAILLWLSLHYVSQIDKTRYSCYGPRVTFTLPDKPDTGLVVRMAFAISPVAQAISSWNLSSNEGTYDPNFDYRKFINDNGLGKELDGTYSVLVAGANNADHATKLVKYQRNQTIAQCLASKSWLTMIVVISHALFAYFIFLTILPVRQRTSRT